MLVKPKHSNKKHLIAVESWSFVLKKYVGYT